MQTSQLILLLASGIGMFAVIGGLAMLAHYYTLNGIKSKTVGDGQYGTARFATEDEIKKTYTLVPYEPQKWRRGKNLPKEQGLVVGCRTHAGCVTALVDTGDIHCLMIGAAGVGKTANFLYPNIEYACASGMSFLCTDTKGDLFRNYAGIAKECYGYNISVLDLRNPTRSDGDNILSMVNKYMDAWLAKPENLALKAKAEKYAKITAKTIICSSGEDASSYGQNAFFYDSAEGLLTSVILLLAEYCAPEKRHIVSVFKLIQDLLAPSPVKNKSQFQLLMEKLPPEHKARWFSGAALNSADQAMASILTTAMSRLNAFLDSEMEQILCFDSSLDTETFCNEKSAIFIVLPEEDNTKYFMVSLFIQQLYREMLTVADEHGGKLPNRVMIYADEVGTIPKIQSMEMIFSSGRSRRLSMVPIIQSYAQFEKNYGKEGSAIIIDNCQDILFGGFAPSSDSADILSKALGNRTVLSGSISRGKNDPSQSLQMIQRPLMTPDELKTLPKGHFILAKTGCCPMQTTLPLFFKWGITFDREYVVEERAARRVAYADRFELEQEIVCRSDAYEDGFDELPPEPPTGARGGGMQHTPAPEPKEHHGAPRRPPMRPMRPEE
ncbi:VirD4-like conjugal transfer protein, CD1115 family [uncultured Oscillibacter sp.]|uniref:VirD4-like conjugal transfer protein, CD1115 family n=1 Tax=uncultured Oscillibacter sp. TaxID=876091 RepID=UPI002805517F|nr:type IV secretory system conjugative DNA transfer family protein [uncultured Oscillibacter sp.]